MKQRSLLRYCALAACLLLAAGAHAEPGAPLQQLRNGYAFDQPRILTQQRLFGIAHGVTLLAAACTQSNSHREQAIDAYEQWRTSQASTIDAATRDLAGYYFAAQAAEASERHIARALKLEEKVALKPGSPAFDAACASFAAALQKPRYDLQAQYRLALYASRLELAAEIEGLAEACRNLPAEPGTAGAELDLALAQWHQRYDVAIAEASTALEQDWSRDRIEGTLSSPSPLAARLAELRKQGRRGATPQRCASLPPRLSTPQADPDDAFNTFP